MVAVTAGVVGWLSLLAAAAPAARPQIGDPAPDFALATLDGKSVTRDQLAGQITVVEFFATWCGPCKGSLEDLRAIRAELGPRVQSLIIVVEPDSPALRAALARFPPPEGAIVGFDTADGSARRWGRDRLPTSFFLDRGAIIRHINRGHGPGFRARATRWLRGLLSRS
jgi:cytochrome c biogenesis protein CcmG/thiol:disulfide interchange protein DsbE